MDIGRRLRELRQARGFSQGDMEKRTGLLRCYMSRVECGHTVPSLETLEKLAQALEIELYQLFFVGRREPRAPKAAGKAPLGSAEDELGKLFGRMSKPNRRLLLLMARKLASVGTER
jgi:transcriptional regulator with XRE-family HTH domain